jgi:hypothetical protein
MLAWYSGSGECRDDQSVYISFCNAKGEYTDPVRVGDKTGNPVIWSHRGHIYLLWSKFEDTGDIRSIVDRWKFCSLWIQRVELQDEITLVDEPVMIASPESHLLGRCNPLFLGQTSWSTDEGPGTLHADSACDYLLPLYDEVTRNGVIYKVRIDDVTENQLDPVHKRVIHTTRTGNIGIDMIQPTLWLGKAVLPSYPQRVHSLSRNFGAKTFRRTRCKYCYSDDSGETWSEPQETDIPNRNSSLHAIHYNGYDLLLWNDTNGLSRINLRLGKLSFIDDIPEVEMIATIGEAGGYPSMCVDAADNLHMTFSNRKRKIEHHVWNTKQFDTISQRNIS